MSSPFIVTYSGSKFDVAAFMDKHPAGAAVIEPYKDKDMTTAFDEAGHSKSAVRQLNKYKIAHAEVTETKRPSNFHKVFWLFALGGLAVAFFLRNEIGARFSEL